MDDEVIRGATRIDRSGSRVRNILSSSFLDSPELTFGALAGLPSMRNFKPSLNGSGLGNGRTSYGKMYWDVSIDSFGKFGQLHNFTLSAASPRAFTRLTREIHLPLIAVSQGVADWISLVAMQRFRYCYPRFEFLEPKTAVLFQPLPRSSSLIRICRRNLHLGHHECKGSFDQVYLLSTIRLVPFRCQLQPGREDEWSRRSSDIFATSHRAGEPRRKAEG